MRERKRERKRKKEREREREREKERERERERERDFFFLGGGSFDSKRERKVDTHINGERDDKEVEGEKKLPLISGQRRTLPLANCRKN